MFIHATQAYVILLFSENLRKPIAGTLIGFEANTVRSEILAAFLPSHFDDILDGHKKIQTKSLAKVDAIPAK